MDVLEVTRIIKLNKKVKNIVSLLVEFKIVINLFYHILLFQLILLS